MIRRLLSFLRRPVDLRGKCGSWRVGELAVCKDDNWRPRHERDDHDPRKGEVLRVVGVTEGTHHGCRAIWLRFAGKPSDTSWSADAFRKPVADDLAADVDFAALIRSPARLPETVR